MSQADYLKISGLVFLVVGLFHAARAFMGWQLVIGSWVIPVWFSWFVAAALIILCVHAFYFASKYKYA